MQSKHTTQLTDVTIELFNYCRGSCTGCLLSVLERHDPTPTLSVDDFTVACARLQTYGKQTGLTFRTVLTFGDVIWMPIDVQQRYYAAAIAHGHRLGSTMTLIEDRDSHYMAGMAALVAADPSAVFDITIDPFRLRQDANYGKRLRDAIAAAPHCHLQVLLSEAVMGHFSPDELSALIVDATGGLSAILGFATSLSNIDGRNYRYAVDSASHYAARYYAATPASRALMAADIKRFTQEVNGAYSDFLRETFHIGHNLNLYPSSYTIYGDLIFDHRNLSRPLGNLRDSEIDTLLDARQLMRMNALNAATLDADITFGCNECEFKAACAYNGVGMARRLYRDFEQKSGSCYGPKGLLGITK